MASTTDRGLWPLQGAKVTPGAPVGLRLSGDLRGREESRQPPQTPRVPVGHGGNPEIVHEAGLTRTAHFKDASRLPRGQKLDLGPQCWRRTLRLSQRAARGHPLPLGSGWDPALGHDGGTGAPSAASVSCVSSAPCWPGPQV